MVLWQIVCYGTFVCRSFGFFFSLFPFPFGMDRTYELAHKYYVYNIDFTDCHAFYSFKCICSNDEIIIKILFLDVYKKNENKIGILLSSESTNGKKRNKKGMLCQCHRALSCVLLTWLYLALISYQNALRPKCVGFSYKRVSRFSFERFVKLINKMNIRSRSFEGVF